MRYSISIWSDIRKTPEEAKLRHPALFPQQLVMRLIECFSSPEDQVVLDPFAGSGSTLIAAARLGKRGVGFEVSEEYYSLALRRLSDRDLFQAEGEASGAVYLADARRMLEYVPPESVDLVITSPPYWDILSRPRTADRKETRDYVNASGDLSRIQDLSLIHI